MSKRLTNLCIASLLAACTAHDTPGSGSTGETTDGGTFGHGETSVSDGDPSAPMTTPTGPTPTTGDVTGEPPDPSFPDTVTVSDTSPTSATTTSTSTSTSTTGNDTEFTTTDAPACNDAPGQPQDGECSDPSGCGCASGRCFVIPILGGFCGECLTDSDCAPGGCTTPNPVQSLGSVCNKGEPGAGCQTDAVCSDPAHADCAPILKVPGIFTTSTCGACKVDADCPADAPHCSPVYDLQALAGQFECVASGSVPNDSGCSLNSVGGVVLGDAACASGHCGEANIMGLVKLGVCGECSEDADCGPGEQCSDPLVDLDGGAMIGGKCG